jgi:hypothetical protein
MRVAYDHMLGTVVSVWNFYDWLDGSGLGGLVVSMVPKIAGSNPAEAVEFFGRKNPQRAFLRRGSKAVFNMPQI